MDPLSSIRRLGAITAFTFFTATRSGAQDAHPDRFGLGVSGIVGGFGGYSSEFLGAEGFVRVAHGSFWSTRVDGAYFGATPHTLVVCSAVLNIQSCDSRYVGQLATLALELTLGPTASNGLRPYYGLLGVGGTATRWGGGYDSSGPASGAGPSLALLEAGAGSEFHVLGGNRIEFRVHRTSPSLPTGNHSDLGAVGVSLTIGVVW